MNLIIILGPAALVAVLAFALLPAVDQDGETLQVSGRANSGMVDGVMPEFMSQNAQTGKRSCNWGYSPPLEFWRHACF